MAVDGNVFMGQIAPPGGNRGAAGIKINGHGDFPLLQHRLGLLFPERHRPAQSYLAGSTDVNAPR